jgi:hypothetical protein
VGLVMAMKRNQLAKTQDGICGVANISNFYTHAPPFYNNLSKIQ